MRDEDKTREELLAELSTCRAALRQALGCHPESPPADLSTLLQQLPAFVYTSGLDPEGSTQYVSPKVEAIVGYSVAEIVADAGMWGRMMHPADRDRVLDNYAGCVRRLEAFSSEYRVITKDGREVWVSDTAQVVYGDGKPLFFQGVVFDITERRRVAAALKRSRDDTERFMRLIPAAMLYVDRSSIVRWANVDNGITQHLQPVDVVGMSLYEVLPQIENPSPRLDGVFRSGEPCIAKGLRIPSLQGALRVERFWDVAYLPIKGPDETVEGVFLFSTEVTDRVRDEHEQAERIAQLQELDRLKGDFINTASHELRTPLTSIMGYAEFLEDELGGPLTPEQVAFVHQIQLGVRRLGRIVDDLLDFARMEAGTFSLAMVEADLGLLLSDEVESLRPQAIIAGVTLECPERLQHKVFMDPKRVGQVLLNLMGNAIKFTPRGGTVRARMHAGDDWIRVEVEDDGIGLEPEHHQRVFEKFFQVDPSTTRTHGGAGLGLAIARALIEAHGGAIGVESRPGEGSTFWFQLPARRASLPAPGGQSMVLP